MLFPSIFYIGTAICVAATLAVTISNLMSFRLSDRHQDLIITVSVISHMVGLAFLLGGSVLLAIR